MCLNPQDCYFLGDLPPLPNGEVSLGEVCGGLASDSDLTPLAIALGHSHVLIAYFPKISHSHGT
jgi:hypothetical protein